MTVRTAANKVVPLARAIQDYWETELPKRHPNYPIVDPNADSGPPPPEEQQLRQLLGQLPEETVYKLALLMFLGRGDFDMSDLAGEYRALRDNDSVPAIISFMMDKTNLADFLDDGMEILDANRIDLDNLNLTPARA